MLRTGCGEVLGNMLGRVRAQRYRPANGAEAAVVVVAAKDEELGPGEGAGDRADDGLGGVATSLAKRRYFNPAQFGGPLRKTPEGGPDVRPLRRSRSEDRGLTVLADPSLVVLDTQSLHSAAGVPADTTGLDAHKKVPGVKRGLAVDVLGLVIAVVVLAASVHDNTAGIALLDRAVAGTEPGTVKKALVDQGFKNAVVDHGAKLGIDVEVVKRNPGDAGFVPQPKRWVVEQVNGIFMLHRRLVRHYEHRAASAESRVYWAMSDRLAKTPTGTSTPTWRGG
ncbi:transposase [Streptomyces sp. NPDC050392]|uniref:transposase n=1 Tax=Streptomyces sp. NPDC050392 TaxID=3155782 RepID=UPI00343239BD